MLHFYSDNSLEHLNLLYENISHFSHILIKFNRAYLMKLFFRRPPLYFIVKGAFFLLIRHLVNPRILEGNFLHQKLIYIK